VLALVLAGCGDSADDGGTVSQPTTGATSGAPAAGGTELHIAGFSYDPNPLTVAPGATIEVTNADSATHDVKGEDFKSADVDKGKTVSFTAPSKPGSYSYVCSYHSNMKGTLVVK
jgi:plastocyanin